MFHFPRNPHTRYTFTSWYHPITGSRFPHSDTLGSTLSWQLPEAYRSLSRPSSAYYAKASTMRPYNTTHKQITKNNHKQKNCMNNRTYRKTRCSRPLSSSHTTPTHHRTNHHTAACLQHAATCHTGTTTHVSSQTPNSAPTTNQHKKRKAPQTPDHHTHTRRPPSLKQSDQQVFHPKNKK